jgi:hypothetical protein
MRRLLILAAASCVALTAVATAGAASAQDASGTWQTAPGAVVTSVQQVGNNCFIHVAGAVELQGTLVGETALPDVLYIFHAPCGVPAPASAHAKGVFTGTIDGVPTTCQVVVEGQVDNLGTFTANSDFRQCTSGAHANLKFDGIVVGVVGGGTYNGHVN